MANGHLGISTVSADGTVGQRGVFETHRYDALGRRLATLSLRGTGCTQNHTECFPYLERTVWDGDQLLYELRAPNYGGTSGADLASGGAYNAYSAYGRVVYRHGGGIDTPLAVTRLSLNEGARQGKAVRLGALLPLLRGTRMVSAGQTSGWCGTSTNSCWANPKP